MTAMIYITEGTKWLIGGRCQIRKNKCVWKLSQWFLSVLSLISSHAVNVVSMKSLIPLPSLASTKNLLRGVITLGTPYWNPLNWVDLHMFSIVSTKVIMMERSHTFVETIFNTSSFIIAIVSHGWRSSILMLACCDWQMLNWSSFHIAAFGVTAKVCSKHCISEQWQLKKILQFISNLDGSHKHLQSAQLLNYCSSTCNPADL